MFSSRFKRFRNSLVATSYEAVCTKRERGGGGKVTTQWHIKSQGGGVTRVGFEERSIHVPFFTHYCKNYGYEIPDDEDSGSPLP